jgi:hypothetical protein
MLKTYALWAGALFACWPGSNVGWAAGPAVSQWLPADAAFVVEVQQPAALLEPLMSAEVAKAVGALPMTEQQKLKLQAFQGIIAYLELQMGTNWRDGLRGLTGQGLTYAVDASGASLLSADAQDPKLLQQLHETVRAFVGGQKENHPERVSSRSYRNATLWTVVPKEAHAVLDNRLLLANRPQLLERVLDLRAEPKSACLASTPAYKAARKAVGADTVASVFVNMQALRKNPKLQKTLVGDSNPLAVLLLADIRDSLSNATWVAAGVAVKEGQLALKLATDGQADAASKAASFSTPAGQDEGPLPQLTVPNRLAGLSLYRDLRSFYAAKDDLFPERTSGLVFFENMMGIFFSGKELTDGVLGQTRPDLRVVVAEQHYDPAVGTPSVQAPAFAAVLRLRQPEQFSEAVEEGWQKALGLINFTRGQQALPGLILDRASHAGVKYTFAYYRPPNGKDQAPVDSRYNYRPSLARTGDYVIFSSTDGLAEDLIDAVKQEASTSAKPLAGGHSFVELEAPRLRALLAANFESEVRKNMVEKGNSREQAESDVRTFLTLLDCFERASLTLSRQNGHPQADLRLKLKVPSTKLPGTTAMLSQ